MRPTSLILLAAAAFWLTGAGAQESTDRIPAELLCKQCPWDAPVRIPRDDSLSPSPSPSRTNVVTAQDMRSLGVISVADMVNQLPNGFGPESAEASGSEVAGPFNLGASIDNLRGLQIELTEQAESTSASTEVPTDDAGSPAEEHTEP